MQRGIAAFLGLEVNRVRVICPDVGGGFGLKTFLDGETIAVCRASLELGRPIKWVQDRFEHLVTDADCRDHEYEITLYADAEGRILGVECECAVDAGAPIRRGRGRSGLRRRTGVGNLARSVYAITALKGRSVTICSNKPPSQPYRGVARPGACFR